MSTHSDSMNNRTSQPQRYRRPRDAIEESGFDIRDYHHTPPHNTRPIQRGTPPINRGSTHPISFSRRAAGPEDPSDSMDATPPIMRYHTPPAHYEDTNPLEHHDPPTFETPKSTRSSHWRELLDDISHPTHSEDTSYHEKIYEEIHDLKRKMQDIAESVKETTLYVLELHVMLEEALRLRAP